MRKFTRESRYSISAANTAASPATADFNFQLLTFNFSSVELFNFSLPLVMPSQRISFHAVLRTPLVRHLSANLPQLREKLVPHPLFQNFHRPPLQRFRPKSDRAMDQLHMLVPEFLKQFVEFCQRLRHHVGVSVRIIGIVDFLDRQPMFVQIMCLE